MHPFGTARSMSLFNHALSPGSRWLLEAGVQPLAGPAAVASLLAAFQLLYNALWLIPVYSVSLVVNCIWCAGDFTSPLQWPPLVPSALPPIALMMMGDWCSVWDLSPLTRDTQRHLRGPICATGTSVLQRRPSRFTVHRAVPPPQPCNRHAPSVWQ